LVLHVNFSNLFKLNSKQLSILAMDDLKFDNLALRTLPIDPVEDNYVRSVSGACFSRVNLQYFPWSFHFAH